MGDGKCTFGVRMPIDITMLNEMIHREVKHFRNYKIYRPNFKSNPVSGKPSSAHDQVKEETKDESQRVDNYHHNVAQTRVKGPKSRYALPVTDNQIYGWYNSPLVPMNRNDRRFYFPQKESRHTKIEIIINMSNPSGKSKY